MLEKQMQEALDALGAMEMTVSGAGVIFDVTYTHESGRTSTPPTELVRTHFLLGDSKGDTYEAVSVSIPVTGVYRIAALYRRPRKDAVDLGDGWMLSDVEPVPEP